MIGYARWRFAAIALLVALRCAEAHAVVLVDSVNLASSNAAAAQAAPTAQTFTVTTADSYTITVTDLDLPVALSSLSVAVTDSTGPAAVVGAPGATVSHNFNLVPGTYTVQPLATAAAGSTGAFTVVVTEMGSANAIFQGNWPVAAPGTAPPAGQSQLHKQFTPATGGSYEVTLTDQGLPAALSSVQVEILQGATKVCATSITLQTPTCQVNLTANATYDLFVVAQAGGAALAGLYSINITATGGGAVAYADTTAVGTLPPGQLINVPSNEMITVQVADLTYPAALPTLQAVVTEGSTVLRPYAAAGSASFAATTGTAQIFVFAQPAGATGEGSYAVYAHDNAGTLLDTAQPVVDSTHFGFAFTTTLANPPALQLSVTDFEFPAQFSALSAVAEQQAVAVANTSSNTDFNAASGIINMVAFAVPAAQSPIGLFRISLITQANSTVVYSATQGVGGLFTINSVAIPAPGNYVLQSTDFGFPADFANLVVVITNGVGIAGEVFGSGSVNFNVPAAGNYVINVVAQLGAGASYGLYGLNLATAPPLPVVTISANPTSITSGQSVTITWSATNATKCTAEGVGAWSGTLATSGSLNVGAVTVATTYTLNCTGPGGVGSNSVSVTILPPSVGGGSGAFDPTVLLALGGSVIWIARRRVYGSRRSLPVRF